MANKNQKKEISPYLAKIAPALGRITLGALFFIAGFNFSNTAFFQETPLFGIPFLAETLISFSAAIFGFHTVPILFTHARNWLESSITKTVTNIVYDFWDQQSKRMSDARRTRAKKQKKVQERKTKDLYTGGIVLDTSVLIDGRILDIVKTGFLNNLLIVPQAVIDELHLISDNDDKLKRQKGRRGLDILNALKKETKIEIYKAVKSERTFKEGVDKGLVIFSKRYKALLMTLDFNLNKVAEAGGVKTLNINDLANAVKTPVIPGEELELKVVQEGKEKKQGVGYMSDGTMVVIEGAKFSVGEEVNAKVDKVIQTSAGKMIFATMLE
ncbi:MAG: PIN/TRAM domain-containing protein [Patescibacteria group bacterium]